MTLTFWKKLWPPGPFKTENMGNCLTRLLQTACIYIVACAITLLENAVGLQLFCFKHISSYSEQWLVKSTQRSHEPCMKCAASGRMNLICEPIGKHHWSAFCSSHGSSMSTNPRFWSQMYRVTICIYTVMVDVIVYKMKDGQSVDVPCMWKGVHEFTTENNAEHLFLHFIRVLKKHCLFYTHMHLPKCFMYKYKMFFSFFYFFCVSNS